MDRIMANCTQRNLPARGFRPAVMLAGMVGVMTYGFWKLGKGIRQQKYGLPIQAPTRHMRFRSGLDQ